MSCEFPIALTIRKATAADAYIPLDMAEHQRALRGCVKRKSVSLNRWLDAAFLEAKHAKIPYRAVVGRSRHWKAVLARWKAWKRILDRDPDYSIKSLGAVCGFDHTSILYGLKKLAAGAHEGDKPHGMPP